MSYILEALRRADAERERGAVPDLRAQPLGPMADAEEPARPRWPWIAGGAAALLLAALAWRLAAGPEAPAEAPPAPMPAPAPQAAAPVPPAPSPQVAPPVPPAAPAPAVTPPTPPLAAGPAPLAVTPATPTAATAPTAPPGGARPAPSVSVVAAPAPRPASATTGATAPKAAASAPQGRIYTLAELPPEIRGQLPRLAVGGSMYSENAANRMLILNGQLFHENDQPAPELTLEQIRLKSAVLRFRGYRYELSY